MKTFIVLKNFRDDGAELDPTILPTDTDDEVAAARLAISMRGLHCVDAWVGDPDGPDSYRNGEALFSAGDEVLAALDQLLEEAYAANDLETVNDIVAARQGSTGACERIQRAARYSRFASPILYAWANALSGDDTRACVWGRLSE